MPSHAQWGLCAVVAVAAGCRVGFDELGALSAGGDGGATGDGVITTPIDAAPGTLLPPVIADTYVQGLDTTPNGAEIGLQTGRAGGNGNNLWSLYWFDVTAVPPAPVTKATLRLYQYASLSTLTINYEIYRITQQWDEAVADWDNATSTTTWTLGGTIASTVYAVAPVQLGTYGFYDWDVTTLVNEWVTGTSPNVGLQIQYEVQPPTGTVAIFASKEHPFAAWRPQLLITP